MTGVLKPLFLVQDGQTAAWVARQLAGFLESARSRIDLAIYDCHLEAEAAEILLRALREQQHAGVAVRIAYAAPHTPPTGVVVEPTHPDQTAAFLAQSGLPVRPINGAHLMHHKYLIVDGGTPHARVWTGSTNITTSAFTLQENNIVRIVSPAIAGAYTADFDELWRTGSFDGSGAHDEGIDVVTYAGAPARVEVRFAPGQGAAIDREVARRIGEARRQVTVASVYLTSGLILGALQGLAARGVPLSGIVDHTQMHGIVARWRTYDTSAWKADAFESVVKYGRLHAKRSTPPTSTGPHDMMHNKVIVVDDTVITGSYNYSDSAVSNAENILFIESPALAKTYRAYITRLVRTYPAA